jgi:hypothetical protein
MVAVGRRPLSYGRGSVSARSWCAEGFVENSDSIVLEQRVFIIFGWPQGDDRSLTVAAQKPFPSRARQEVVYANFRKLVLIAVFRKLVLYS